MALSLVCQPRGFSLLGGLVEDLGPHLLASLSFSTLLELSACLLLGDLFYSRARVTALQLGRPVFLINVTASRLGILCMCVLHACVRM